MWQLWKDICELIFNKNEELISWKSPRSGILKLNTDSSVFQHDLRVACGGLVRDCSRKVTVGFYASLGLCNAVREELWGILKGLRLAFSLPPAVLTVETNSKITYDMITVKCPIAHPFADLIRDLIMLLLVI